MLQEELMSIYQKKTIIWKDTCTPHFHFAVVQLLSYVQFFLTPCTTAHQTTLSPTVFQSLLRFISTESVMLSKHLIPWHPLLHLPSISPNIWVFSNESALSTDGASDSASVLPMNIQGQFHLGLIDWFDHFSVQESQESSSAPQFKSIISSLCKLFYGPTFTSGKTIALTLQNFVDKVMPLLFNTLWHSFVSRSKCLLISWL